jgi:hypothetical protein
MPHIRFFRQTTHGAAEAYRRGGDEQLVVDVKQGGKNVRRSINFIRKL